MESIQEMDDKFAEAAKKNIENAKVFKMKEQDAAHSLLSPCPFCESQPEWINESLPDGHFYIRCPHCHIVMKEDRRDKVIGMWNRRDELTRLRSELQQEREKVQFLLDELIYESRSEPGTYFMWGRNGGSRVPEKIMEIQKSKAK